MHELIHSSSPYQAVFLYPTKWEATPSFMTKEPLHSDGVNVAAHLIHW